MFRIAALENSARAHEIRDLLTRFNTPFTFHASDSGDGVAPPARRGRPARASDGVFDVTVGCCSLDPTDGDLVEAVGGGTRLGSDVYDVAILGGPAGLSAAVYTARKGSTLSTP